MFRLIIKKLVFILSLVAIVTGVCVSVSDAACSTIDCSKHNFSVSGATGVGHFAGLWQVGSPAELGPLIEEICVFCHTPHGASKNAQTIGFLWNRTSSPPSGYTYLPYTASSSTLITPDTVDRKPTGISMMCMSCHDGVTSIAVNAGNSINFPTLLNPPNATGVNAQVSLDPFQSTLPPGALGAIGDIFKGNPTTGGWGANIGNAVPGGGTQIDLSNDHPISFEWALGKSGYNDTPNPLLRLFGGSKRRIECATCHTVHNPSIEPFLAMSNAQSLMCRSCHLK